jgi:hypothetical protein
VTGEACASIEAHKSFSTSGRLAPLSIISSVRFSAARRDSACDGVVVFRPCPDSDPPGCARLAALLSCMSWSGVKCNSGELIVFSIWGPVYESFVIDKCSRTAHSPGAHDLIQSSNCLFYLRMSSSMPERRDGNRPAPVLTNIAATTMTNAIFVRLNMIASHT